MMPITKFEMTKLLGIRAEQLSKGAIPKVDTTGLVDPLKIAFKEIEEGVIPLKIKRTLPNGRVFEISIKK